LKFLSRQPLRRQIIVVTGALLLLLIAAIAWSANRSRLERQAEVQEEALSAARLAAAYLDQHFSSLDGVAALTVRAPAIAGLDPIAGAKLLRQLIHEQPLVLTAVLVDRDGRALVSEGDKAAGGTRWTDPPAHVIDAVRGAGRQIVTDLYVEPSTGKQTIAQAHSIPASDGTAAGVLAFELSLEHLQEVVDRLGNASGAVATLTDQRGRIVARSEDGGRHVGATTAIGPPVPGRELPAELRADIDGVERFTAAIGLTARPWLLSVGIARTVVRQRLVPLWWRNLGISVTSALAVLGLALFVTRHTSEGLNRLRTAAQRIAGGDLSPPPRRPAPNQELAELQSAFETMAGNLRATRDALDQQVEQERKMREALQSLQRQVVRQERLAAVGLLVSGVAHELNNPLQAILGTAELLERAPGAAAADMGEEIALLKTQSARAREIIRNLSRFGSQHTAPPALVDLRTVIAEVVQLRRHDLNKAGITIDVDASTSALVYANLTELEQVTLNFVINAQQAIESTARDRGRILVRLYDVGRRVRLEVHDDGPGVAPDHEPKLFQPFFTTKPVGKGTGLGLSVSYGIIDSYGGTIGCRANEWRGATFFFELPAAEVRAEVVHRSPTTA
jgi:signal transduction histidine kinase